MTNRTGQINCLPKNSKPALEFFIILIFWECISQILVINVYCFRPYKMLRCYHTIIHTMQAKCFIRKTVRSILLFKGKLLTNTYVCVKFPHYLACFVVCLSILIQTLVHSFHRYIKFYLYTLQIFHVLKCLY